MTNKEIDEFIDYLKTLNIRRVYLSEVFIKWYRNKFIKSENESTEVFISNEKRIGKRVQCYISSCESKYLYPEFKFSENESDVLISTKFLVEKEHQNNIEYKLNWRTKLNEIIRQLDWREFELLGKQILSENHIKDIIITKSHKDQGIDFYGYFDLEKKGSFPRFYNYFKFRIIGQVKHSKKNSAVPYQKVASFGTELNKLRKATDKSYFTNLDDKFINSNWPIIGIFITNEYYPNKAEDFAKDYGIIFWDGEQISQDLATEENIKKILDVSSQELKLEKLKDLIVTISQ